METAIKDETEYHDKLFHALSGTYAKRKSIQFDAQKMKDSYNVYQKDKKFDSIICMNATDRKIYVYQLNGL